MRLRRRHSSVVELTAETTARLLHDLEIKLSSFVMFSGAEAWVTAKAMAAIRRSICNKGFDSQRETTSKGSASGPTRTQRNMLVTRECKHVSSLSRHDDQLWNLQHTKRRIVHGILTREIKVANCRLWPHRQCVTLKSQRHYRASHNCVGQRKQTSEPKLTAESAWIRKFAR